MIVGVKMPDTEPYDILFGTHNGIFHSDEVVGISILQLAFAEKVAFVVRTRDLKQLKLLDIVIDVGGGNFDHHIPGFAKCRPTGEMYASAGLVWGTYGEQAVRQVMVCEGLSIEDSQVQEIVDQIDREYIIPVDLEDNGKSTATHAFSFIPKFIPSWLEEQPDYDYAFGHVVTVVTAILDKVIKDKIVKTITTVELSKRFEDVKDGIVEIPAQTVPWLEDVVSYNQTHGNVVKFVIFPYPAGGWAAQCVPPSIEGKNSQLVPFPKAWAGGNEETLPGISGIHDATFCHNFRFFARARSKESVIKMCEIAMG